MKEIAFITILFLVLTTVFARQDKDFISDQDLNLLITPKKEVPVSALPMDPLDPQKKVSEVFVLNEALEPRVRFWHKVYTKFNSQQMLIHDKENMSIIYDVISFDDLQKAELPTFMNRQLQKQLTHQRVKQIKAKLQRFSTLGKLDASDPLIKKIQMAQIEIPKEFQARKRFFKKLIKNLRSQTGQKDKIKAGLERFNQYKASLAQLTHLFSVPQELLFIPFLESSFNWKAKSRVGAAGPWQFMRRTARKFMVINKTRDDRLSPILSTISALFLLKQNKLILGTWDLAISAYNMGPKHFILAKKKLKSKKERTSFSLIDFIKAYKHPHVGFASKNFYSEFLALAYSLTYPGKYFYSGLSSYQHQSLNLNSSGSSKLAIYLLKCRKKITGLIDQKEFKKLNPHLKSRRFKSRFFKKATPFFSSSDLNTKFFYRLSNKEIRSYHPKNYKKIVKKMSCK